MRLGDNLLTSGGRLRELDHRGPYEDLLFSYFVLPQIDALK